MKRDLPMSLSAASRAGTFSCPSNAEVLHESRLIEDQLRQINLSVPSIRCGGCIQKIEKTLGALDSVESVRVNLTTKRVVVVWKEGRDVPPFVQALAELGYTVHLENSGYVASDKTQSELVRALAVAGFATGNIMLLSVSVWSGADPAARDLFHGISALIALPALVYSGRIFFRSAARALRHGRTNMDVPISIGVLLAFAMSLFETLNQGEHAYFEASVMLLFFLLIGRTLEHLMREKARHAISGLAKLIPRVVQVVRENGNLEMLPASDVEPGATVLVAAGERVPVDGQVVAGISDVDQALVTGESSPHSVSVGSFVQAGTLNLSAPLTIETTGAEGESFLAEMVRLMEAAESGRPAYRRIADRAAGLYAPVVHGAALASLVGWMVATGDLHHAVTVAVAVLIITCPCALGLAVPMVQVVAARRLFEHGIMMKDGTALERLTEIDTVVFDKTGTLTAGSPVLQNRCAIAPEHLAIAAAMASRSRHPLSIALTKIGHGKESPIFDHIAEHPGCGLEATSGQNTFRLGRAAWALSENSETTDETDQTETILSKNNVCLEAFRFHNPLRPGVEDAIATLLERGMAVRLLSGDRPQPVRQLASDLKLDDFEAEVRPDGKVAYLDALAARGHKVLMVGDGLNDAPALSAAHAAIAPASAADVGRNAADLVFLGDSLEAVPFALTLARRAHRLIRQNFLLASAYNGVALPFAILGFVTPLVAAAAMSLSSVIVVANALRLSVEKDWSRQATVSDGGTMRLTKFASEPVK